MIARVILSVILAAFVTVTLFWGMQALIFMDDIDVGKKEKRVKVRLAEVRKAQEVEQKVRKPDKPDEVEAPPEMQLPDMNTDVDNAINSISMGPVAADTSLNMGSGGGFAMSDGDYLPIVRVQPQYPRRALERGLEGYVVLDFTVNKLGKVVNIVVEESTSSVFNRAAVKAASKFKYKPKVVDGEPQDSHHVKTKITFNLEKGR